MSVEQQIKQTLREVADFPKEGIVFRDLTPLLLHPELTEDILNAMILPFKEERIDAVCAIESRGFLYGMLLANKLNVPFLPVRKKGKLPGETLEYTYDLEYGSATVEVHLEDIQKGWNIMVHDDLLATGGTAAAATELMRMRGAQVVGFTFIVELGFLHGRQRLEQYSDKIISLASFN
ncbi:MAG: adenine phosphoribosyltransferase [Chitinophagales bacterium]|nr:adenine phosphoribosyltransferase [Chitinophagales bacterium]HAE34306.1 adenine phosphoribosyltransferase [Bacteroidota bacterium]MCB9020796.1 adenine phosphoribosyltransferase [Chitinophagales bacterium]MCB9031285.1 adenine phosphoribosyltransferase [Chitinophagales bacterium]HPE97206.1 adenine phosphoribosyltransferase [Chitinophagales bacterium]